MNLFDYYAQLSQENAYFLVLVICVTILVLLCYDLISTILRGRSGNKPIKALSIKDIQSHFGYANLHDEVAHQFNVTSTLGTNVGFMRVFKDGNGMAFIKCYQPPAVIYWNTTADINVQDPDFVLGLTEAPVSPALSQQMASSTPPTKRTRARSVSKM